MPAEANHISLANKNHAVLLHLQKNVDDYPEWVTVVAFYKAVQIVEAVLVHKRGRSYPGHQQRLNALKSGGYQYLHRHYRALWGASSVARYLCDTTNRMPYSTFADYLSPDQVVKIIIKKRLHGVECEAVGLLSDAGKTSLIRLPS